MIHISKMTDYAIVLLTEIHSMALMKGKSYRHQYHHNLVASASCLSATSFIPLPTVQWLLKKLAHGGFLLTERGRDGGYRLKKPLADISLFDVLLLIEGAPALTACVEARDNCDKINHCHLWGRWQKVNLVIHNALKDITLSDLLLDDQTFQKHFQHYLQPANKTNQQKNDRQ
ncbi:MAG: RrF2 family transcriptional regulator [Alphaproteobacteria bacterium]